MALMSVTSLQIGAYHMSKVDFDHSIESSYGKNLNEDT